MSDEPRVGNEVHPFRLPAFVLSVLLGAGGVIALVWVWIQLPDRADQPGYWPRTLGVTLAAGLILWSAAWLIRRTQPAKTPHAGPAIRRTTWAWPLAGALWGSDALATAWVDRSGPAWVRGLPIDLYLELALAIFFLAFTTLLARDFARRTEASEFDVLQGIWLIVALGRCYSSFIAGGEAYRNALLPLAAVLVGGVALWLYWHRRPRAVPS